MKALRLSDEVIEFLCGGREEDQKWSWWTGGRRKRDYLAPLANLLTGNFSLPLSTHLTLLYPLSPPPHNSSGFISPAVNPRHSSGGSQTFKTMKSARRSGDVTTRDDLDVLSEASHVLPDEIKKHAFPCTNCALKTTRKFPVNQMDSYKAR